MEDGILLDAGWWDRKSQYQQYFFHFSRLLNMCLFVLIVILTESIPPPTESERDNEQKHSEHNFHKYRIRALIICVLVNFVNFSTIVETLNIIWVLEIDAIATNCHLVYKIECPMMHGRGTTHYTRGFSASAHTNLILHQILSYREFLTN